MLHTVRHGQLEYFTAGNLPAPHCFTTRKGGVSSGHLASLNLGTHRGDQPENVLENFRIVARELDFDPQKLVLTTQTHTDIVRLVTSSHHGAGLFAPALPECDGLITNTPGTALAAFTADCTPILLADPITGAVGAVHAGWRGTAARIGAKAVEAMVSAFGCDPKNIRAAIGPNIAQCCFETDADVPQAMVDAYGKEAMDAVRPVGDKYYVNLKAINALGLQQAGVTQIAISSLCTRCDPDRFWSHRRTGQARGSLAAIIVCKEVSR